MPPPGPKSRYVRHEKSLPRHNNPSSAQSIIKAPFVPAAPKERPGWKGIGFQKPKKKQPPRVVPKSEKEPPLQFDCEVATQQKLVNVARQTFPQVVDRDYEELKPVLAKVREAMEDAEGEEQILNLWNEKEDRLAYIARWSPIRALILAALLQEVLDSSKDKTEEKTGSEVLNVLAIGGNTTDLLGWAAYAHLKVEGFSANLSLVDAAPWTTEIGDLEKGLRSPPQLSKYASAAARAAAVPFISPGSLKATYQQRNVLSPWAEEELKSMLGQGASIITLSFVLKDLQRQSLAQTIAFFISLTAAAPNGSLLLIVDEPDVEVAAGEKEKRYPLRFFLDLALLGRGVTSGESNDDSDAEEERQKKDKWEGMDDKCGKRVFEPAEGLKYPLGIGKVGVQVHLFRRR